MALGLVSRLAGAWSRKLEPARNPLLVTAVVQVEDDQPLAAPADYVDENGSTGTVHRVRAAVRSVRYRPRAHRRADGADGVVALGDLDAVLPGGRSAGSSRRTEDSVPTVLFLEHRRHAGAVGALDAAPA